METEEVNTEEVKSSNGGHILITCLLALWCIISLFELNKNDVWLFADDYNIKQEVRYQQGERRVNDWLYYGEPKQLITGWVVKTWLVKDGKYDGSYVSEVVTATPDSIPIIQCSELEKAQGILDILDREIECK